MNIPRLRLFVIRVLKHLGLFDTVRKIYFRILRKPLPGAAHWIDPQLQSKILMHDVEIAIDSNKHTDTIIFLNKKL